MRILPGTVIAPPMLPSETVVHLQARARGEATRITADRHRAMAAAAERIEQAIGALIWTAPMPVGRAVVSVIRVEEHDVRQRVGDVPSRPLAVMIAEPIVERYVDMTGEWEPYPLSQLRPRLTFRRPGDYRISGTVAPLPRIPPAADEALARMWSYEDSHRPVDEAGGAQGPRGGVLRAGAGELIRVAAESLGGAAVPM